MSSTREPSDDPLALGAVQGALSEGDIPRAVELARQALAKGEEHPLLLNLRAYWLESAGRNAEALADLKRAQAMAPDDPVLLNALGLSYARNGKLEEARASFAAAIARDARFAHARFNQGWTAEELGDLDAARESFREAARLDPKAGDPLARLAALAARLGEWSAARDYAGQALAIDPRLVPAILALASADVAAKDLAAAKARLERLLEDKSIGPTDRGVALGQLGDILDAEQKPDEAYAAYASGNMAIRTAHLSRFRGAGIETIPHYLGWLTRHFARVEPWTKSVPGPAVARSHVFVLSFPRSGTTLLEEALAAHPDVVSTGEKDALAEAVREFMGSPAALDRLATAPEDLVDRHREIYWRKIAAMDIDANGRVLIDKQPYNTPKLPVIARLFPDARIVFALRDPRDVVLSCFRRRFRMNPSNFELLTLEGAAEFYDATMKLAALYRSKLPLALMESRHEDLIADLEPRLRMICEFAGLAWTDGMLDFTNRQRGRAIATPSATQIAKGINRDGVGQWRNYRSHMTEVLPLLEPWAARFGYSPA